MCVCMCARAWSCATRGLSRHTGNLAPVHIFPMDEFTVANPVTCIAINFLSNFFVVYNCLLWRNENRHSKR